MSIPILKVKGSNNCVTYNFVPTVTFHHSAFSAFIAHPASRSSRNADLLNLLWWHFSNNVSDSNDGQGSGGSRCLKLPSKDGAAKGEIADCCRGRGMQIVTFSEPDGTMAEHLDTNGCTDTVALQTEIQQLSDNDAPQVGGQGGRKGGSTPCSQRAAKDVGTFEDPCGKLNNNNNGGQGKPTAESGCRGNQERLRKGGFRGGAQRGNVHVTGAQTPQHHPTQNSVNQQNISNTEPRQNNLNRSVDGQGGYVQGGTCNCNACQDSPSGCLQCGIVCFDCSQRKDANGRCQCVCRGCGANIRDCGCSWGDQQHPGIHGSTPRNGGSGNGGGGIPNNNNHNGGVENNNIQANNGGGVFQQGSNSAGQAGFFGGNNNSNINNPANNNGNAGTFNGNDMQGTGDCHNSNFGSPQHPVIPNGGTAENQQNVNGIGIGFFQRQPILHQANIPSGGPTRGPDPECDVCGLPYDQYGSCGCQCGGCRQIWERCSCTKGNGQCRECFLALRSCVCNNPFVCKGCFRITTKCNCVCSVCKQKPCACQDGLGGDEPICEGCAQPAPVCVCERICRRCKFKFRDCKCRSKNTLKEEEICPDCVRLESQCECERTANSESSRATVEASGEKGNAEGNHRSRVLVEDTTKKEELPCAKCQKSPCDCRDQHVPVDDVKMFGEVVEKLMGEFGIKKSDLMGGCPYCRQSEDKCRCVRAKDIGLDVYGKEKATNQSFRRDLQGAVCNGCKRLRFYCKCKKCDICEESETDCRCDKGGEGPNPVVCRTCRKPVNKCVCQQLGDTNNWSGSGGWKKENCEPWSCCSCGGDCDACRCHDNDSKYLPSRADLEQELKSQLDLLSSTISETGRGVWKGPGDEPLEPLLKTIQSSSARMFFSHPGQRATEIVDLIGQGKFSQGRGGDGGGGRERHSGRLSFTDILPCKKARSLEEFLDSLTPLIHQNFKKKNIHALSESDSELLSHFLIGREDRRLINIDRDAKDGDRRRNPPVLEKTFRTGVTNDPRHKKQPSLITSLEAVGELSEKPVEATELERINFDVWKREEGVSPCVALGSHTNLGADPREANFQNGVSDNENPELFADTACRPRLSEEQERELESYLLHARAPGSPGSILPWADSCTDDTTFSRGLEEAFKRKLESPGSVPKVGERGDIMHAHERTVTRLAENRRFCGKGGRTNHEELVGGTIKTGRRGLLSFSEDVFFSALDVAHGNTEGAHGAADLSGEESSNFNHGDHKKNDGKRTKKGTSGGGRNNNNNNKFRKAGGGQNNASNFNGGGNNSGRGGARRCCNCNKEGHVVDDCVVPGRIFALPGGRANNPEVNKLRSAGCFRCGRPGHFAAACEFNTSSDGKPLPPKSKKELAKKSNDSRKKNPSATFKAGSNRTTFARGDKSVTVFYTGDEEDKSVEIQSIFEKEVEESHFNNQFAALMGGGGCGDEECPECPDQASPESGDTDDDVKSAVSNHSDVDSLEEEEVAQFLDIDGLEADHSATDVNQVEALSSNV